MAAAGASVPLVNTRHANNKNIKLLAHERDARASRKNIVIIQLITNKHPKKQQ